MLSLILLTQRRTLLLKSCNCFIHSMWSDISTLQVICIDSENKVGEILMIVRLKHMLKWRSFKSMKHKDKPTSHGINETENGLLEQNNKDSPQQTCLVFTFASLSVQKCSLITLYKTIKTFTFVVDRPIYASCFYTFCWSRMYLCPSVFMQVLLRYIAHVYYRQIKHGPLSV